MSGAPRHHLIPILSLTGVILDALGGLYLAYDLLGGKKGPLRIVTKSVSYGVMFGSVYGLPLGHVHMDISCSPAISRNFDIALALLHNFWYPRALSTFDKSFKRTPNVPWPIGALQ
jgi:hypothetical protein